MARILLIDDDYALRTMLRMTLAYFGHTVIEAGDGNEGLALFSEINADLVITDLVMPDKDGTEVIMELRKKSPPVKIIAMSGGDLGNTANSLDAAKAAGAAVVLEKPFSSQKLIAVISDLVPVGATEPPLGV